MILTDLPLPAKIEMRESLRNLRVKGLIDNWQPAYNSFDKPVQNALRFMKEPESEEDNDESGTRMEETNSIGC
jgi:hypothetical protein